MKIMHPITKAILNDLHLFLQGKDDHPYSDERFMRILEVNDEIRDYLEVTVEK